MSHVLLLRCDREYPQRTPHRCTAYRPLTAVDDPSPWAEGWTVDAHGYATCPSCNRADNPPTTTTTPPPR